jgi:DNA polymerase-3 subunit beta
MELTLAKKDLVKLLSRMQGVAERKSTMPILANVLLAVEGPNALRVAATDLYLSIAAKMSADISKGGSVAVSAKDLLERVKMMPEGPIFMATQENAAMTLKAQGTARRYTLRGMPGDDFPPIPLPAEGAPTLALDVAVLGQAHHEDALLDLDRRDARAPELRALRVGRGPRTHGHDRRS